MRNSCVPFCPLKCHCLSSLPDPQGFLNFVIHVHLIDSPHLPSHLPRVLGSVCGACTEDGTFRQYVHSASSRRVCDSSGYWTPEEAVGKGPWLFHLYLGGH